MALLAGCEPPMQCNGHTDLCDRRVDEVALGMTHNAMSNAEEGWGAPNQNFGIERQLSDGVRGFMLDTHYMQDETALCHSICELGSEPLDRGLAKYTRFLDEHPHEVIVFVFQSAISAEDTQAAFIAADLLRYTYAHEVGNEWPTLRELIEADTRVIATNQDRSDGYPWYNHAYSLAWDNDYSAQTVDDFGCDVLRGDASNDLFLLNHFITNPVAMPGLAEAANPDAVLWEHVDRCMNETGDFVNWVSVDFYDIGDLFTVVDRLNGVETGE